MATFRVRVPDFVAEHVWGRLKRDYGREPGCAVEREQDTGPADPAAAEGEVNPDFDRLFGRPPGVTDAEARAVKESAATFDRLMKGTAEQIRRSNLDRVAEEVGYLAAGRDRPGAPVTPPMRYDELLLADSPAQGRNYSFVYRTMPEGPLYGAAVASARAQFERLERAASCAYYAFAEPAKRAVPWAGLTTNERTGWRQAADAVIMVVGVPAAGDVVIGPTRPTYGIQFSPADEPAVREGKTDGQS